MSSSTLEIPPLPTYTLTLQTPLLPPIPDKYLSLILPVVAYWALSMVFHFIDTHDYFSRYRLHTPAEVLKRNRVSRWEVVRDVLIQQVVQTAVGIGLAVMEPDAFTGMDQYNVAIWAQRLRMAQSGIPALFAVLGVDAVALAQKASPYSPILAGVLAGGKYPWLVKISGGAAVPSFAPWEMLAAQAIYWALIPAMRFLLAICIVDTWQYFLHRAMHMNKWLYTTFHARHHRLYVPYAYGALYNHPLEGFLLDTLGTCIAYLVSGMTPRQGLCFFTGSTIKTVDDHCGYALPWDPLQHLTSNNAGYHDIHHQSWGIKTNFSQPFFTFWDRALGTVWTGGDVSARYEKARLTAEHLTGKSVDAISASQPADGTVEANSDLYANDAPASLLPAEPQIPAGQAALQALSSREHVLDADPASVLADEEREELRSKRDLTPRAPRKKSAAEQAGSLMRDRVSGRTGFHGRAGSVLGMDSGR